MNSNLHFYSLLSRCCSPTWDSFKCWETESFIYQGSSIWYWPYPTSSQIYTILPPLTTNGTDLLCLDGGNCSSEEYFYSSRVVGVEGSDNWEYENGIGVGFVWAMNMWFAIWFTLINLINAINLCKLQYNLCNLFLLLCPQFFLFRVLINYCIIQYYKRD